MSRFDQTGEGWDRPAWRQALLWLRWRPWCWLKGLRVHILFKGGDIFGEIGPFKRFWLLGKGDPWEKIGAAEHTWSIGQQAHAIKTHYEDEQCDCGRDYTGEQHYLFYIPAPDYRWIGDDWNKHDRRWYKLKRPGEGTDAAKPGSRYRRGEVLVSQEPVAGEHE